MPNLGMPELLVILVILVLLFGTRKLPELGKAYKRVIGNHFPAMSVVEVKGLIEPGAKLEIEATAILASGGPD